MNRAEKAIVIEQLQHKAQKAGIALVTDFRGLKVNELEDLREILRENNIDYQVVKNTLAKIAFSGTSHGILNEELKDCCGIAFGYDDPVVAAKLLTEFAKKNKKFSLRFASYEGQFLSEDSVAELSKLPGRDELLAKLLATMNAVPTNFVGLFANVQRTLLYALNAIKEQKENH